jgi:hypothetical protein
MPYLKRQCHHQQHRQHGKRGNLRCIHFQLEQYTNQFPLNTTMYFQSEIDWLPRTNSKANCLPSTVYRRFQNQQNQNYMYILLYLHMLLVGNCLMSWHEYHKSCKENILGRCRKTQHCICMPSGLICYQLGSHHHSGQHYHHTLYIWNRTLDLNTQQSYKLVLLKIIED